MNLKSVSISFWAVGPVYLVLFAHSILLASLWTDRSSRSLPTISTNDALVRSRRHLVEARSDRGFSSQVLRQDEALERRLQTDNQFAAPTRVKRTRSDVTASSIYGSAASSPVKDASGYVWLGGHSKVPVSQPCCHVLSGHAFCCGYRSIFLLRPDPFFCLRKAVCSPISCKLPAFKMCALFRPEKVTDDFVYNLKSGAAKNMFSDKLWSIIRFHVTSTCFCRLCGSTNHRLHRLFVLFAAFAWSCRCLSWL